MGSNVCSFTIWGRAKRVLYQATVRIYLAVHHSETWENEHCEAGGEQTWPPCRVTTVKLDQADVWYGSKRMTLAHVGGTFIQRLAAGDWMTIVHSKDEDVGFVYPAYGGSVLTFRGELISVTSMGTPASHSGAKRSGEASTWA